MHMSTFFVISSALRAGAASGLAIDMALITKHLGIIVETEGPGFNILTCFKFVLLAILFSQVMVLASSCSDQKF